MTWRFPLILCIWFFCSYESRASDLFSQDQCIHKKRHFSEQEKRKHEERLKQCPKSHEFVHGIFERLVDRAGLRDLVMQAGDVPLTVACERAISPNAHTSSSYIQIDAGLLLLADSEDEVAAIIGHELTHYLNCDSFKSHNSDFGKTDRALESRADAIGLEIAVRAGYSSQGAIDRLLRRQKILNFFADIPVFGPIVNACAELGHAPEEYHPYNLARILSAKRQARLRHYPVQKTQKGDLTASQTELAAPSAFGLQTQLAQNRQATERLQKSASELRELIRINFLMQRELLEIPRDDQGKALQTWGATHDLPSGAAATK